MSNWYYADRDRQRHGPMERADLVQRFNDGLVGLDALVWRDGMAQWQPLSELAGELGLLADAPIATQAPPAPTPAVEPSPSAWAATATVESVVPRPSATSPYAAPLATLSADGDFVAGGEIVYAGFLKRLAASMLDSLVVGAVMLIVLLVVVLGMGIGGNLFANMEAGLAPAMGVTFVLLFYLVPLALQGAYFTLMHASGSQATLGKLAVGIKVARGNGERISVLRSLGRFAGLFVLGVVTCNVTFLASAIMAGVTERKQGLHDMISDTVVVDRWAFTAHPERQRRELGGVTLFLLALVVLAILGYVALIVFAGIGAAMAQR